MPVPPAELTARLRITEVEAARAAALRAAEPSGLARETGPGEIALAGGRAEVLAALDAVLAAALDAGARRVEVRLEAPTEARPAP